MAKKIILFSFLLLIFLACQNHKTMKKPIIIATINGKPIYEKDFIAFYNDPDIKNYTPELKKKLLINMIIQKIVEKDIKNTTLPETLTEKIKESFSNEQLQNILKQIYLLRLYLNKKAKMNFNVKEEDIKKYYNEHISDYFERQALLVYQLLFKDEKTAEKIYKELKKDPKKFGEYTKIYNNKPYSENGGCLGWVEYGDLPKQLEKEIYKLRINRISKPIKSKYGYHIFWIKKKRNAKYIPYNKAKEEIKQKLLEKRIEEEYKELVQNSFKLNKIEINEKYLYQ